jgi:hypothetical protein
MFSFSRKVQRLAFISTGFILFLFGLVGALFGLLSIVDPVGTQMADDFNPFGEPPTPIESIVIIGMYLVLAVVGGWLFNRGQRAPLDAT